MEKPSGNSFVLHIDLGNAAMSDRDDVARALEVVAMRLRTGDKTGNIRDGNGNTVGQFSLTLDEE